MTHGPDPRNETARHSACNAVTGLRNPYPPHQTGVTLITVTGRPPHGTYVPFSRPRPGFATPQDARDVALVFAAGGKTPESIRRGKHPGDGLFMQLADAVDAILAEGLTPQDCRALLGITAKDGWLGPDYCSECSANHPGACGCWCHQPVDVPAQRDAS